MRVKFFSLLLLGLLTISALAQDTTPTPTPTPSVAVGEPTPAPRRSAFRLGLSVGYSDFTSSETSDTFGGEGFSISPAFGTIRAAHKRGELRPDFGLNFSRSNGNTLIFVPLGVRYVVGLSEKANQPYVGLSANIVPAYTKIDTLNQGGKFDLAGGGSAFAGYNFSDKYNIEARYYLLSKIRGYDVSNFQVSAGIRF